MNELSKKLEQQKLGSIKLNEPLKHHTTWKIGGPARVFFEPDSLEGLQEGLKLISAYSLRWFALGRGSNILISDKGIDAVVIKLGDNLANLHQEESIVTVEAGHSLIKLATIMSKKGYSGLEFAGGIPGSVGGAVFMNAGAHQTEMSDILTKALILMPNGEFKWMSRDELGFEYRTSILQENGGICIAAQLQLIKGDLQEIRERLQKNKAYRKNTQPWKDPCCGSVFRNPLPMHAGKIIEELGLKGYSIGGAKVSELHGNFIVNTGEATAKDVINLIEEIKQLAWKHYGVQMETEVEQIM
ncbi:UDP-N-acetylmuramate dehydrogenase [Salipaludibacillus daqingensis]|uniref:UDP-N-acetylmuramate dehydrogenase n=1 Tax=Salipaludibacillus daqingensis TaxID=3041001 RepID=UPI003CC8A424